jgi:lipoyl(octanoyl) transferase
MEIGIQSGRVDALTGVWIKEQKKICAIGIHCSRWITSHGFALNVNNDLQLFSTIVPCGITERGVTSVQEIIGDTASFDHVQRLVEKHFLLKFRLESLSS